MPRQPPLPPLGGLALLGLLALAGCGGSGHHAAAPGGGIYKVGSPYEINGRWYYPAYEPGYDRTGTASWYGGPVGGRAAPAGGAGGLRGEHARPPPPPPPRDRPGGP